MGEGVSAGCRPARPGTHTWDMRGHRPCVIATGETKIPTSVPTSAQLVGNRKSSGAGLDFWGRPNKMPWAGDLNREICVLRSQRLGAQAQGVGLEATVLGLPTAPSRL